MDDSTAGSRPRPLTSIAHELNNLITVVCGNGELALAALAPGDPNRENLEAVLRAARRAAEAFGELWERLGVGPPESPV